MASQLGKLVISVLQTIISLLVLLLPNIINRNALRWFNKPYSTFKSL